MNYKIYCTYHDENLVNEYDLKETDNFKLFYTKNSELNGYSLNYVQLYLNEWVTQYYIWKNNIKSDYVGFCHYRRIIEVNEDVLNELNKNGIYSKEKNIVPQPLYFHFGNTGLAYTINVLLLSFIYNKYKNFINIFYNYINDDKVYFSYRELYICKWEYFCEMTSFINDFILFIFDNKYNNLYDIPINEYDIKTTELNNTNWELFEFYHRNDNVDIRKLPFFGYPRNIAYAIEHIIGIYLNLFIKNNISNL